MCHPVQLEPKDSSHPGSIPTISFSARTFRCRASELTSGGFYGLHIVHKYIPVRRHFSFLLLVIKIGLCVYCMEFLPSSLAHFSLWVFSIFFHFTKFHVNKQFSLSLWRLHKYILSEVFCRTEKYTPCCEPINKKRPMCSHFLFLPSQVQPLIFPLQLYFLLDGFWPFLQGHLLLCYS